jgi:hypothetical protein
LARTCPAAAECKDSSEQVYLARWAIWEGFSDLDPRVKVEPTSPNDAILTARQNRPRRKRRVAISLVLAILVVAGLVVLLGAGWWFVAGQSDAQVNRILAAGSLLAAAATVLLAVATLVAVREAGRQAEIAQAGVDAARAAVVAANSEAAASLAQAAASDRLAKAAADQAKASARTAKAAEDTISEMRRGRALEYRPHLKVIQDGSGFLGDTARSIIKNIGRGPALDAVSAVHWLKNDANLWGISDGFELGADDVLTFDIEGSSSVEVVSGLLPDVKLEWGYRSVMLYSDLIGSRYRLIHDENGTSTQKVEPDEIATGPEWARWPTHPAAKPAD